MTHADKYIVDTYSILFEGLSSLNKLELIESLSKSLKTDTKIKEERFYKSIGDFSAERSAEEIIKDIKSSRKFKKRQLYHY